MAEHSLNRHEDPRYRGRGAGINPAGRFEKTSSEISDDGWRDYREELPPLRTSVTIETPKSVLTRNQSPDVPFDRSVNPYRGCEHGCIYCFARPSHGYLNLSSGVDFETKLFAKPTAAALLQAEISEKNYKCRPIAFGTNTDPYQPIEKERKITRSILEMLGNCAHPFTVTTKSALVTRDIDILAPLAERRLTAVGISVTSLDPHLSRRMEPRASSPAKRIDAIKKLTDKGIPVVLQLAPVIPAINDMEMERIMETAKTAGATQAIFLPIRLPFEVSELFQNWLQAHFPDRASKVMAQIRSLRGGRENDPRFKERMKGQGAYAEIMHQRFTKLSKKLGFSARKYDLDCSQFKAPGAPISQLPLFS
ncbi:PA0069 family radical SAM protein [Sneathiella sp. P13V-1]|uniref:PA0069 family radical SAM protein n=1 Tax=Sneathiella sp. P13V-1 TaxID=2697366 RepID=UPI00187BAE01|nr:PA0069 family radical SAM protein [Sneathiella sp. P13V-1]MBE7635560.1 PA0069 family radical SAM protein [Sneathiella sp. P13V-1]